MITDLVKLRQQSRLRLPLHIEKCIQRQVCAHANFPYGEQNLVVAHPCVCAQPRPDFYRHLEPLRLHVSGGFAQVPSADSGLHDVIVAVRCQPRIGIRYTDFLARIGGGFKPVLRSATVRRIAVVRSAIYWERAQHFKIANLVVRDGLQWRKQKTIEAFRRPAEVGIAAHPGKRDGAFVQVFLARAPR
ncbi:hypothetical protein D3C80_1478870 [compost metagenome]